MEEVNKIFTVSEINQAVKNILEPRFTTVQIKGEVFNLHRHSSGHIYFSLKDSKSVIPAALFSGDARRQTVIPKEGDQVIVKGSLSLYLPKGAYQIIVREIALAGVGDLLLKLHQLKEDLQKKGWFDADKKKALPKYPKTIGVVTSPTGSVIQDILNILSRRHSGFQLILNPVKVQGNGAAEEIAAAIKDFNKHKLADVLIVGRGGGSLEDLWPFNELAVAEAVFHSEIPIISAVGHETDFTICDLVASVRAPTPSAAAEIAISEKQAQLKNLSSWSSQIYQRLMYTVNSLKANLKGTASQTVFRSPYYLLGPHYQKIDECSASLSHAIKLKMKEKSLKLEGFKKQLPLLSPFNQIAAHRKDLARFQSQLHPLVQKIALRCKENLARLASHLMAIDPKNLLTKGYCIPFAENSDSVIISTQELSVGQKLRLLFSDGDISTEISKINPTPRKYNIGSLKINK